MTLIHENRNNLRGAQEEVAGKTGTAFIKKLDDKTAACCTNCRAWRGELGLEPYFFMYIDHLCQIFDEVKRVRKPAGTLWVNLGDTYNSHSARSKDVGGFQGRQMRNNRDYANAVVVPKKTGVPDKSLCQIPNRFAIEMTNRGWILRNELIWWKPNCMPSSARDRFTVDFEKIFFFAKEKKYFFETQYEPYKDPQQMAAYYAEDAISSVKPFHRRESPFQVTSRTQPNRSTADRDNFIINKSSIDPGGRNKRTVWRIPTKPFPEAHFAVYPPELVETPIKAGCPEFVCRKCGRPREKILNNNQERVYDYKQIGIPRESDQRGRRTDPCGIADYSFVGYTGCDCNAGLRAGIVFDPFAGAGTTLVVAKKLGRLYLGCELNPAYVRIARQRLARVPSDKAAGPRAASLAKSSWEQSTTS